MIKKHLLTLINSLLTSLQGKSDFDGLRNRLKFEKIICMHIKIRNIFYTFTLRKIH